MDSFFATETNSQTFTIRTESETEPEAQQPVI